MATVTPILDVRVLRKDGTAPVKFCIRHAGSAVMISTGIYLRPEQWNGENVAAKSHKQWQAYRATISSMLADIQQAVLDLTRSRAIRTMTAVALKKIIEKKLSGTSITDESFVNYIRRFMDRKEKSSTREGYGVVLKKVIEYGGENLQFSEITTAWLSEFDAANRIAGLKINSRETYLRRIRAVFNDAIDNEVIGQECYPFRRFKLKTERTAKRSLAVEDLRRIRDWDGEPHERQYVDMFMLIFYLRGINMIDLCHLKEIRSGLIEYKRAKTGRIYSVKVEPEALEIIERYRGKNHLLNILDRYKNYKDYYIRMNRALKKLGAEDAVKSDPSKPGPAPREKVGAFPALSTYWARHSWATIAASLDIPKETIAAGLGHGGNTVTDIYIDFDQKKVDDANRRIIDFLNESSLLLDIPHIGL